MLSGDRALSWGCSTCKGSKYEDGDELRKIRGCEGNKVESLGFAFDPSLRQCPWSVIDNETWVLVRWWSEWEAFNVLPWSGDDPMKQPAFVLEVFEICETEKREAEKKAQEKHRQEMDKMRNKAQRNGR